MLLDGSHGGFSLQSTGLIGGLFITVRHLLRYEALLVTVCSLIRIFRIIFFLLLADICRYELQRDVTRSLSYQRNVRSSWRFGNITVASQVRLRRSWCGEFLVRNKWPPGESLFVFIALLFLSPLLEKKYISLVICGS